MADDSELPHPPVLRQRSLMPAAARVPAGALGTLLLLLAACGDPDEGELLVQAYGCVACHEIQTLNVEPATVGPTLRGIAERRYIAVGLPNTPENLVRWITAPQEVIPGTAMPDLNVTEREAWAMAAYLLERPDLSQAGGAGGQ